MAFLKNIPLSLYVHLPWCKRKCPYCDFNSHEAKTGFPEQQYIAALLCELEERAALVENRTITSIFFGGGTPSLFSAQGVATLLTGIKTILQLDAKAEITLEANPGTVDEANFAGFFEAGINRLSLGIQSLDNEKLTSLGRIHDREEAIRAIHIAKRAGFTNFNLDIMYGLPNQSIEASIEDLKIALSFEPSHFSWYQLTIEPNTYFYKHQPALPSEEQIIDMQEKGQALLQKMGFQQYEVSAYARPSRQCQHNLNYWEFGDYLGIGAGAHSKISDLKQGLVTRFAQIKQPQDYLIPLKRKQVGLRTLSEHDLIFEFMLNALRLTQGVPITLFEERTGLAVAKIEYLLKKAKERGLMAEEQALLLPSPLGKQFLNDLTSLFLPKTLYSSHKN